MFAVATKESTHLPIPSPSDFAPIAQSQRSLEGLLARLQALDDRAVGLNRQLSRVVAPENLAEQARRLREGQEPDVTVPDLAPMRLELERVYNERAIVALAAEQEEQALDAARSAAAEEVARKYLPTLRDHDRRAAVAFLEFARIREERFELGRELHHQGWEDAASAAFSGGVLPQWGSQADAGSPLSLMLKDLTERGLLPTKK